MKPQVEKLIIGNAVAGETTVDTFIASASDKEIKVLSADGTAPAAGKDFKIYQKTANGVEFSDLVKADKVQLVKVVTYAPEVQKVVKVTGFTGNVVANTTYTVEVRIYNPGGSLSNENYDIVSGYHVTGSNVTNVTAADIRNGLLASINANLKLRGDNEVVITASDLTAAVKEITLDAALITGNTLEVTVDGVALTEAFATTSDAALAAMAGQIASQPGVATAVVTTVAGTTEDDRVIVVTAADAGTDFIISDLGVSGGVTQAGVTQATTTENSGTDLKITGRAQKVVPGKMEGRQIQFDVVAKQFNNASLYTENLGLLTTSVTTDPVPGKGTGKYAVNLEWFTKGYDNEVYRETGYPANFDTTYYASLAGIYNVIHLFYFDDRASSSIETQEKLITILVDKGTDTLGNNAETNKVLADLSTILGATNVPAALDIA